MENSILKIREIRIAKGITQKACADFLGMSVQNYCDIENQRNNLKADDFLKLCNFLDIDLNLFRNSDNVYLTIKKADYQKLLDLRKFLDFYIK